MEIVKYVIPFLRMEGVERGKDNILNYSVYIIRQISMYKDDPSVIFEPFILDVPDSNFGRVTSCPTSWFPLSLWANNGIICKNCCFPGDRV